jgi:hypothetical protein
VSNPAEPVKAARATLVQVWVWEQDGLWEWDIRWPGPPAMRSTGARTTLESTMSAVTYDVLTHTRSGQGAVLGHPGSDPRQDVPHPLG